MQFRDLCTKQCAFSALGLLFIISGVLLGIFGQTMLMHMVGKEMALSPGGRSYEAWKTPPIPMSLDIYFFNWTNPKDFNDPSTKPIFEELGPYRFTEKQDKVDINWHPENHTVSFRRKSDFYFDQEGSNGSLDDNITILNVVAYSAAAKSKYWSYLNQQTVNVGLKAYSQPLAVTKSADELLFTGYSDDMIDIARSIPIFGDDVQVPFDKFGWFYTRNGSADLTGHFNMYTGMDDLQNIGKMHEWNYKTHSGFFDSYCGMINGSAGEFYPPNLKEGDSIAMFSPDMCRSIDLEYTETRVIDDLTAYKFSGGPKSVDNGTLYPENKCFCGGECMPSGVMNISACRYGTPVFMSYPHFYNADPIYASRVEGLEPTQSKHEFYMILEKNTGVALEVAARFQVNILVEPYPNIGLYSDVPKIMLPLIWFEQKVIVPKELTADLSTIPFVLKVFHILAGVFFAIGLIMISWFPVDRIVRRRRGELKPKQKASVELSMKQKKDMEAAGVPVEKIEGSPLLGGSNSGKPVIIATTAVNHRDERI